MPSNAHSVKHSVRHKIHVCTTPSGYEHIRPVDGKSLGSCKVYGKCEICGTDLIAVVSWKPSFESASEVLIDAQDQFHRNFDPQEK